MARKEDDFMDGKIKAFQDLTDNFYEEWIKLNGREGITNYVHMLDTGHIAYFLWLYRNLYQFSNQGWESLNSKIMMINFHNAQHSRYCGGNCIK